MRGSISPRPREISTRCVSPSTWATTPSPLRPGYGALASEVDPTAVIGSPVALDQIFNFNWYIVLWFKLGAGILTGILLALSVSGIYALMSFTVVERTREIGIRTALGAQRSHVALTIAKRALVQLGVGVSLGMIIAGWLLVQLKSGAGRIPTHSPFLIALAIGASVMVLIGMLACMAPNIARAEDHADGGTEERDVISIPRLRAAARLSVAGGRPVRHSLSAIVRCRGAIINRELATDRPLATPR